MHEALHPISWLIGRWSTTDGHGSYPTMKDFSYHDILEFNSVGQPMLNFSSTSSHPEKGTPMHQERGFLRIKPGTNHLSFLISHNFGLTSIEEGTCDEEKKEIELKTISISRMSFAKEPRVKNFVRKFRLVSSDTLDVIFFMETDNTEMTQHLKAIYKKTN